MDETLKVYADSTSPNGMCIIDPEGKFSQLGFKLCETSNNSISDGNRQSSSASVNSGSGGISAAPSENSGAASVHAASCAARISVASKAHAKLLADESARLDAQQQAVKRLLASQKYTQEMGQANLKRVQDLQTNLTNKLAASIASQRSKTDQILANSQMQQKMQFASAMTKTKASLQSTGDLIGASRALAQAKKQAEQQRLQAERQMQEEINRITEEHNRQHAELQLQHNQLQKQLDQLKIHGLEQIRVQDLDNMSKAFQPHITAAEKLRDEAQRQNFKEHNDYYAQKYDVFPERVKSHVDIAKSQHAHALKKQQEADNLLKESDQRIALLITEREVIEKQQSSNPTTENQERWFRHEHSVNLAKHERALRQHAAEIRADHVNKTRYRVWKSADHLIKVTNHYARIEKEQLAKKAPITTGQALAIAATTLTPAARFMEGAGFKNTLSALTRIAFASTTGPMAAAGAALFYSKPVGQGSDKVSREGLIADSLSVEWMHLPSTTLLHTSATVDSQYHARVSITPKGKQVELIKTVLAIPIRVLPGEYVSDGIYRCTIPGTLPGTDEIPARTILVTPDKAPGADGPHVSGVPGERPESITNTGNQGQPVQLPLVTTYPDLSEFDFNAVIVVPPLESGYQPVYVMLSGRKGTYEANKGAVGNMGEFFQQYDFGKQLEAGSQKTNRVFQGQTVYKATVAVGQNIRKGNQFYLHGAHKNHLEIFNKNNEFIRVLNLDGSINAEKTERASKEQRTLEK